MHLMVKNGPVLNAKIFFNLIMITDDKKIILWKGQFLLSFSLYLALMILIFSIYFGIFPLDYRLTGVKLASTIFYKICIKLNVIHGLWIVPRKVQIKLWSTLASLWNFDPRKWEFLFFLEMKTWVNLSVLVVFSSCKPAADQTPIRGMESDSPGVTNLWRFHSCCQIWENFQHHHLKSKASLIEWQGHPLQSIELLWRQLK